VYGQGTWRIDHGQDGARPPTQALYAQDAGLPRTRQEAWPEVGAGEEAQAFLTHGRHCRDFARRRHCAEAVRSGIGVHPLTPAVSGRLRPVPREISRLGQRDGDRRKMSLACATLPMPATTP
jgi:hypothetical protein